MIFSFRTACTSRQNKTNCTSNKSTHARLAAAGYAWVLSLSTTAALAKNVSWYSHRVPCFCVFQDKLLRANIQQWHSICEIGHRTACRQVMTHCGASHLIELSISSLCIKESLPVGYTKYCVLTCQGRRMLSSMQSRLWFIFKQAYQQHTAVRINIPKFVFALAQGLAKRPAESMLLGWPYNFSKDSAVAP